MNILHSVVFTINVFSAIGVIFLVLMQHGKGADLGASFGGGASGSIFGAAGSANFLSRTTAILATIFFVSCLGLTYLNAQAPDTPSRGGLMESYQQQTATTSPDASKPGADPAKSGEAATGEAASQTPVVPAAPVEKRSKSDAVPD